MTDTPRQIDLSSDPVRLPLRIAVVGRFPPSCAGAPDSVAQLVGVLRDELGAEVEVIRLVEPGDDCAPGPPVTVEVNPRWEPSARIAAARSNQADVLVIQWEPELPVTFIEDLVRESTAPAVMILGDPTTLPPDAVRRISAVPAVRSFVVPSETARRRLSALTASDVEVAVVPYGAAWEPLDPPDRPRRCVLTWGFLRPGLGIERVIRALAPLRDIDPPVHLRVVGVSHPQVPPDEAALYREHLQSLAEELGVADRVEFHPIILSKEELIQELAGCDVVTVTYDNDDQTASRIITEAVAAGRPVVATRFPGAEELLRGGAGITVPHEDPDELADALRTLLTDDARFFHACDCARRAGAELGWHAVGSRLGQILVEAAASTEPTALDHRS